MPYVFLRYSHTYEYIVPSILNYPIFYSINIIKIARVSAEFPISFLYQFLVLSARNPLFASHVDPALLQCLKATHYACKKNRCRIQYSLSDNLVYTSRVLST